MNFNLGPLTTTFTAPADCASVVSDAAAAARGQTCTQGNAGENPSCHPASTSVQGPSLWQGEGYFSPGLFCPLGYSTACYAGALATATPSFSFQYAAPSSNVIAGCCPSGYACNYATYTTCNNAPYCTVSFQNCVSFPTATLMGVTCASTKAVTDVPMSPPSVYAPMFQLVANVTSTSSGFAPTSAPAGSGKGLSGGAIAGIVIGSVFGFLILLACILFLLRRARRNGRSFSRRTTPLEKTLAWGELSDSQKSELEDSQRNELADSQRNELADTQKFELPAVDKKPGQPEVLNPHDTDS